MVYNSYILNKSKNGLKPNATEIYICDLKNLWEFEHHQVIFLIY